MFSISRFFVVICVTLRVAEAFFNVQHRWQSINQRVDTLLNSRYSFNRQSDRITSPTETRGIKSGSSSSLYQSSSSDSGAVKTAAFISQELNPGNTSAFLDFEGRNHSANYLTFDIELSYLSTYVLYQLYDKSHL